MSDRYAFLPVINENQYNLLISLANVYLRENLSNLLMLARDGMANPAEVDTELATSTVNEITALKDLLITLDNLDRRTHIKSASTWPVRISLPINTLLIVGRRLLTIHQRYQSIAGKPDAPTQYEWWDKAVGVHPNDLNNVLLLIGSLEAIDAQVPNLFKGMTIMTGLSE